MTVPVSAAVGLGVVLVAVGLPYGVRVGRTPAWALAATPAVTGVICSGAVMASVLTRTSMVPWLAALALGGWVALAVAVGRTRSAGGVLGATVEPDAPGLRVLVVAAVVAVLPVLLVDLPATESDARWMWWFHASWFRAGGDAARDAMADPAYAPSRPNYPPLTPGLIAAVWHVGGAYHREMALRVGQLYTAAAVSTTAYVVTAVARPARRAAPLLAAVVAAIVWSANVGVGLAGFVDLTWAALLAPAAVLLLGTRTGSRAVALAAVLAAAAALTKYEGQAAALLLVGVAVLQRGRPWRTLVPVGGSVVGAVAAWQLVTLVGDAPSDERGGWSDLGVVLDPSDAWSRLHVAVPHLIGELGWLVGLSAAAVVLLVVLARRAGTPLEQPGLVAILGVCAGYLAFLALTLADFADAAYRTVIVVRVLVLVDLVLALVATWRALGLAPGSADAPDVAASVADGGGEPVLG